MPNSCVHHVHKLGTSYDGFPYTSHRFINTNNFVQLLYPFFAHNIYTLTQVLRRFSHVNFYYFISVTERLIPGLHTPYYKDYKLNYMYI